jgi:hypothetical protein
MDITVKQMIEGSDAIKQNTISYSDTYILTGGGVLNIYDNLSLKDCKEIEVKNMLRQIQFAKDFKVLDNTLFLINKYFLTKSNPPPIRFTLNGFGAFKNLDCLEYLPNMKSITVDFFKNNEISKINKWLTLESIGIVGDKISIKEIVQQKELKRLFVGGKLKDIEVIGQMKSLRSLSFSQMTLKSLDFLVGLNKLEELNFMLGGTKNLEALPKIPNIKKMNFTYVRQLLIPDLMPLNQMKNLQELEFDTLPHLTDLDWLTDKNIKVKVRDCKSFNK